MKTTLDISGALFAQAKRAAAAKGTTFKELVERALRLLLKAESRSPRIFRLRRHTFRGKGLVAGIAEGDWQEIRRRAYEGRGG